MNKSKKGSNEKVSVNFSRILIKIFLSSLVSQSKTNLLRRKRTFASTEEVASHQSHVNHSRRNLPLISFVLK